MITFVNIRHILLGGFVVWLVYQATNQHIPFLWSFCAIYGAEVIFSVILHQIGKYAGWE